MVIMKFQRLKPSSIFLPYLTFICLTLHGQNSDSYLLLKKEADSLIFLEKHKEAAEIYKSILNNYDQLHGFDERINLEYMTGYSLMLSGQDIQAMPYFHRVITNSEKNEDHVLLNDAMTGLGKTYEYTGKLDSAFYWYMEAYKRVRESDDTMRRARGARNMAQILRVLKCFDEAHSYCREAAELIPGIKDYKVVANIYNETACLFELSDELDSAEYYYRLLIDYSIAHDYQKGESVGYSNLASVFESQKRFSEALEYKLKGIEIDREIGDTYGLMTSYRAISSTYFLVGNHDKALETLHHAHELCDTIWLPDMAGIMLGYYEIYKVRRQYSKALEYYEAYNSLHDQINKEESSRQVTELLTRYETERKEQQIKILQQANTLKENRIHLQWFIIGAMILIGLLLISTSWLWIRNKNQELKQMNTDLKHFIIRQKQIEEQTEQNKLSAVQPGEIYKKWELTSRESEILYHLSQGSTNTEIAERLFVSENTIKFHIKNIYIKLDVKNRIQALLRCNHNNNDTT